MVPALSSHVLLSPVSSLVHARSAGVDRLALPIELVFSGSNSPRHAEAFYLNSNIHALWASWSTVLP